MRRSARSSGPAPSRTFETRFRLPDEIAAKGRGGTDFRPGFAWLDEQGIESGVCLYFTDMECSDYPEAEPAFPTIWVDYGDPDSPWRHPEPWGERIGIAA